TLHVDCVPYVQALEEPKRDPKRLWRTRLDYGPASRPQTGPQKWQRRAAVRSSRLLRFWLKAPNTNSEIGTTCLARGHIILPEDRCVTPSWEPPRSPACCRERDQNQGLLG